MEIPKEERQGKWYTFHGVIAKALESELVYASDGTLKQAIKRLKNHYPKSEVKYDTVKEGHGTARDWAKNQKTK